MTATSSFEVVHFRTGLGGRVGHPGGGNGEVVVERVRVGVQEHRKGLRQHHNNQRELRFTTRMRTHSPVC